MEVFDCIIVGGGPAGLNAAVVLGRCQRKVLLFDTAQYRNKYSHAMHNYLTRDDIDPAEFIKISQHEIFKYGVELANKKVVNARKNTEEIFVVKDEEGTIYHSKKLLIATGLTDPLPKIEGFEEMYGKSVFHCPYCDGWEVRNKSIGVYAKNKNGFDLAISLKGWSPDVAIFTDGVKKFKPHEKDELAANNIVIITLPVLKIQGTNGMIEKIVFKNGSHYSLDALFFVNGFDQQCNLAETFNCEMSKQGKVLTNQYQQTKTPGLYVAGDADKDMHFVVVAAAEGAKAGTIINKELQKEISKQRVKAAKPLNPIEI
ncbi:NAD(P)/FAD-dependent oxidoreductase [Segetibacter sp.]|jgi:thioredoxin reductase|uniref:NAD(P)/FAD-dependent oxidoreductase n=1 Tax=Segetibacter sp. TaxID=2231182 RepID=UPI0026098C71|nr:NAD(P)/FAD-dependent oxidoreductase [Segetibacter sp.]MCW3082249.1 NAD(P)/FAD-dependent oxidoreductase [Segetibacter sp.]